LFLINVELYDLFKRKPLVDALLDRLRHHCITLRIDGPSLRVQEEELEKTQDTSSTDDRK
jgi:DNA replication protein DnaC